MTIDLDPLCSKCGSNLEAAVDYSSDSEHTIILKVDPCNHCVVNADLPTLVTGAVTPAEEIASLRAELSDLRGESK